MVADDSLVINHDAHYNKLLIEETNYADLIKFKLSNGEKLPTLNEYILEGKRNNKHTLLVCEIKPSQISKERGRMTAGYNPYEYQVTEVLDNYTYLYD